MFTTVLDLVVAYKRLLNEKAALETSLAAFTTKKTESSSDANESTPSGPDGSASKPTSSSGNGDATDQLRMQISTLMNSLATLSAEKSKMEASFQADKRSLRQELKQKDQTIFDLQGKLNAAAAQTKLEVEKVKSKLIIERHEWDKESGNQLAMVRELQKLLADERQIKENLQMQLNDLKNRVSKGSDDVRVSEISAELEQTKRKLKENERELNKATKNEGIPSEEILKKLQSEMQHLKQQHTAAIQSEQHRACLAEERNKALAAMHEERVASLESRLAELSATVGLYDRLRQTDQDNIAKFKERIAQLSNSTMPSDGGARLNERKDSTSSTIAKYNNWNANELVNEILLLHNMLLVENSKLDTPIDLHGRLYSAFETASGKASTNGPCDCAERHETLLKENADLRSEIQQTKNQIDTQKANIKTLQTKIEVLNRNLDEQETELRNKSQDYKNELRAERTRWREVVANTEAEYRLKQSELEGQLQKQRERSLALLEEKENEIATLKASFDVFMMPKPIRKRSEAADSDKSDIKGSKETLVNLNNVFASSDDVNQAALVLSGKVSNSKEPMPMLHYVHELSRKDVEISSLRKAKHAAEQTLRQALQDKATSQQTLYEKIATLEENVDRLERCKTREGANLEYLKNVFLSFLLSNDKDGRRHKVNAISAVLQFSPTEMNAVNKYFNANDKK